MTFNVLVVDDSAIMRTMIKKTMSLSGVQTGEIHEAEHGVAALKVLEENWVDLILVDINMPVMNGEELINVIRDTDELRDLAIIVVSTERSETRVARLKALGAEFVHKPFTPEELRETIQIVTGVEDVVGSAAGTDSGGEFDF